MELYQEILSDVLSKHEMQITFPDLQIDAETIVRLKCYQALERIKKILEDGSLEDAECFQKIEAIVAVFETLGSDGGNRHDFG